MSCVDGETQTFVEARLAHAGDWFGESGPEGAVMAALRGGPYTSIVHSQRSEWQIRKGDLIGAQRRSRS